MTKRKNPSANDKQIGGNHYKTMGVQPWDVVDTWPLEMRIGAYRAGALKYLMRMGSKDESVQEIGKGIHYMEKLQEVLAESSVREPEQVLRAPARVKRSGRRTKVRHG